MHSHRPGSMLHQLKKAYSPREEMPLAGYAVMTAAFNALLFALARSSRPGKPGETIIAEEMLLAGIATHKLSRIITKDAVTSFIRASFTRYQEPLGYGELSETPRKGGKLEVVGEVLNCNYCMSAWAGLGIFWGLRSFPDLRKEGPARTC